MAQSGKLSLFNAILININIMLGSGIFINTVILTRQAGGLSPAVYLLVGVLLLPLIVAIAQLIKHHEGCGTFYHFGSSISPYFGFISSWSYFVAKLATCALGIHVCVSLLQQIIPVLARIPTLLFDCTIIVLFVCLNMLNLKMGQKIQYGFLSLKLMPICFAIFAGLYLFTGAYFTRSSFIWSGVPTSIPLVLYAFSGFEASCSLSQSINDAEHNGPRAVLISYALVLSIVILFQFMFFGSLGRYLGTLVDYREAFPALLTQLLPSATALKDSIVAFLHIGIAASALGASYGIMYSNSWNLYTLAQHNHVCASDWFTHFNKHHIPYACILIEGVLAITYLLLTRGDQIPLQQVSALGSTIAYTLSSISLLIITQRTLNTVKLTPLLSVATCLLLIGSFIWSVITKGVSALLILFVIMLIAGTVMFYNQARKHII